MKRLNNEKQETILAFAFNGQGYLKWSFDGAGHGCFNLPRCFNY
jgi:hypothetical protein